MGYLVDWQIRERVHSSKMIEPFVDYDTADQKGKISYGLSSGGYDMRLGTKFKLFTNRYAGIIDPKNLDPRTYDDFESSDRVVIPPMSYILAQSIEYFRIPRDIITICVGKSTYARSCVIANLTPFESEWEGIVTLEISNPTILPVYVYPNEGICQVLFIQCADPKNPCERSYADKKGRYQNQQGIVLPHVI